jgi:hypothetical protein
MTESGRRDTKLRSLPALEEAALHIVVGLDHHEEARTTHADVRVGLERIGELAASNARANDSALRRSLADIAAEARLARAQHADTERSHRSIRRAMESAQTSIARAAQIPAKDTGEVPPSRGQTSATPRKWLRWRKDEVRTAPAGDDATDRTREESPRVD